MVSLADIIRICRPLTHTNEGKRARGESGNVYSKSLETRKTGIQRYAL